MEWHIKKRGFRGEPPLLVLAERNVLAFCHQLVIELSGFIAEVSLAFCRFCRQFAIELSGFVAEVSLAFCRFSHQLAIELSGIIAEVSLAFADLAISSS